MLGVSLANVCLLIFVRALLLQDANYQPMNLVFSSDHRFLPCHRWYCHCDVGESPQTQRVQNTESSLYSGPILNTASFEEKVFLKDVREKATSQVVGSEAIKPSDRQSKPPPKDPTRTVEKASQNKPKIISNGRIPTASPSDKESKTKTPQTQSSSQKQDSSHKKQDSQAALETSLTSGDGHQSSEEKKGDVEDDTEDAKKKGQQPPASSDLDIQTSSVPADSHIPSPVPSKADKQTKSQLVNSDEKLDVEPSSQPDREMRPEATYRAPDYLDQGGSTSEELLTQPQPPESEVMPSFDEWKKMMLAEQERDGYKVPVPVPPGKKIASHKRRRNYASYECGAKIVASNVEAESTSRILNELVDEYMLNPCKAKIWFVIELCESIQVAQIELANFELFSSSPNTFSLHWSDRFPTREWTPLGTFSAQDQRVLQTFEVQQQGFGKFLKLEFLSYYGSEHYCPLSLVRVFGTSMVDEYEEMETADSSHPVHDDEEDRLDTLASEDMAASKNLFGSATEAVMSIVKKAAQVLSRDHKEEDAERQAEKKDVEKPCKSSDDQELNCTDWNKSSSSAHANGSLPSDHFVKKTLRSSAYSVAQALFPYLQRCSICSALPKVDDKQSHSEPVLTCRFLQAALGPVLFGAVCHLYKEKEIGTDAEIKFHSIPSVAPSLTKSFKESLGVEDKQTTSQIDITETTLDASLPLHTHSIPVPSSFVFDSGSHLVLTPNIVVSESSAHSEQPTLQLRSSIQPTGILVEEQELPVEKITVQKSEPSASPDVVKSDTIPTVVSPSRIEHTEAKLVDEPLEKEDSVVEATTALHTEPLPATKITSALETEEKTPEVQPQFGTKISSAVEDTATKIPDFDDTSFPVPIVDISITVSEEYSDEVKQTTEKLQDFSTLKNGHSEILKDKSEQPLPSLKIDPVLVGSVITPPGQKESVFMRMGNRIKALELNMSLSSQYLQELSQRYRRQMEEMQKAFNRTIGTLNDTARKAAERDLRQQEAIGQLQSQLSNLTQAVGLLLDERDTMHKQMLETHICLMAVEAIIMITVLSLCVRRLTTRLPIPLGVQDTVIPPPSWTSMKRSSSFEGALQPISKKVKKRSNSEELVSSTSDIVIVEPGVKFMVEPIPKVKKKHNKHRKNKGIQRSVSNPTLPLAAKKGSNSSLSSKVDSDSSAGLLFSHAGHKKSKACGGPPVRQSSHSCENCVKNLYSSAIPKANPKSGDKERRASAVPLQNLTNGVLHNGSLEDFDHEDTCCKNMKFSLKKFLKIQKRDSV